MNNWGMSSSGHTINADAELTQRDKIKYFALNLKNNIHTQHRNSEFILRKFNPGIQSFESMLNEMSEPTSPSRTICNMFWRELNWDGIRDTLTAPIKLLEVGCGSGRYGFMIDGLTPIESYLGVDISESGEWNSKASERLQFRVDSYENLLKYATNQNLIITQSALEHFSGDLQFFSSLGKYADSVDFPILSIHLFPSPVGLIKFLLHGIRQYNRRTISTLIKSANCHERGHLWALGGIHSNFAHITQITLRSLFMRKPLTSNDVTKWREKLRRSIARDFNSSSVLFPSFYALIISWNCDSKHLGRLVQTKSSQ
jgi:SAM-dependent methyltransferase